MAKLMICYADDGEPWFDYVKSWLQKHLSAISFDIDSINLDSQDWVITRDCDTLLIILSPALLGQVLERESEFHKLHKSVASPQRTFGLYCGLVEDEIEHIHWNDFDKWTCSSLGDEQHENALDCFKKFFEKPPVVPVAFKPEVPRPGQMGFNPFGGVIKEMQNRRDKRDVPSSSVNVGSNSVNSNTDNKDLTSSSNVCASAESEESSGPKPNSRPTTPLSAMSTEEDTSVRGRTQKIKSMLGQNIPGVRGPIKPPKPKDKDKDISVKTEDDNIPSTLPPKPPVKPKVWREPEVQEEIHSIPTDIAPTIAPKPVTQTSQIADDKQEDTVYTADQSSKNVKPLPPKPGAPMKKIVKQSSDPPEPLIEPEATSHSQAMTVGVQNSEKQSSSSHFRLFPTKVQFKDEVLIILSESTKEEKLSIKIENRKMNQRDGKIATRLNELTFSFVLDCDDMSPGELHIIVFEKEKKCLGREKIKYNSNCDMISKILPKLASPVQMMCDILNLDTANTEALDRKFAQGYFENCPRQYGPFYNFDHELLADRSDKVIPTMLHLAAQYGLLEFAKMLITFPSASHAYRIDNCEGCSPKDIAMKAEQPELVKFFEKYEIAILDYETNMIYEDMMTSANPGANSGITEEEIYLTMGEGYLPMFPVNSMNSDQSHYDMYEVCHLDGTKQHMELVMEDSNSDEGPNLRVPIDEFSLERRDSVDSNNSDYLKMDGIVRPSPRDDDDDDEGDYVDGDVGKKFVQNTQVDLSDEDDQDYLSLEASDLGLPPPPPPEELAVDKKKRLPPPPPLRPGTSRPLPMSASSFLNAPVEEENPYVDQSSSLNELVLIQEECKKGMFNQEQTLKRFEHWKTKFDSGTTTSLKTRMGNLHKIRRMFFDKGAKKEDLSITHLVDKNQKQKPKKTEARAPATLPRVDIRPQRPHEQPRTNSARSASTLSSGSSRASNLSVGDSGNTTADEVYMEYDESGTSVPKASSNIYTHSPTPRSSSPPPPLPPRVESRFPAPAPLRPLPDTPGSSHSKWHDTDEEDRDIKKLGLPPRVPPKHF